MAPSNLVKIKQGPVIPAEKSAGKPVTIPQFDSEELFHATPEIRINHKGAVYTLRITRTGGLILNK
ncbi:hemin uptake protein HemP [Aestuariivirga sp.]|uniref:hemin uptake protein HemP n=1 Tax=Aestuariivirga sp. TaxID=2650926 RepID=UPI0039E63E20